MYNWNRIADFRAGPPSSTSVGEKGSVAWVYILGGWWSRRYFFQNDGRHRGFKTFKRWNKKWEWPDQADHCHTGCPTDLWGLASAEQRYGDCREPPCLFQVHVWSQNCDWLHVWWLGWICLPISWVFHHHCRLSLGLGYDFGSWACDSSWSTSSGMWMHDAVWSRMRRLPPAEAECSRARRTIHGEGWIGPGSGLERM